MHVAQQREVFFKKKWPHGKMEVAQPNRQEIERVRAMITCISLGGTSGSHK
jgi:hypothetical protein